MQIPTQQDFQADLLGGAPVQLSGGITPAGGDPQASSVQPIGGGPQGAATAERPARPSGDVQGTRDLIGSGGSTSERLLQPIGGNVQQSRGQIGQLGETFRTAAGPAGQTFESRGGQEALEGYLGAQGTSTQRQAAEDRARAFTAAKYAGPAGIDQQAASKERSRAEGLATQAGALGSGYGLQSILSAAAPGLTRGQLRFEAKNVLGDEGFRRQAASQAESAANLVGQLAGEEEQARQLAAARANEEAEIQRRAREYLGGGRGTLETELAGRVSAEKAASKQLEDAWAEFQRTGDPNALLGVPGASNFEGLNTPGRALQTEAEAKFNEIMNDPRFAGVAGFDPLGLMISKRGREKYTVTGFPEADVSQDMAGAPGYLDPNAALAKKPKQKAVRDIAHQVKKGEITKAERRLLEERERAFREAGFGERTVKNKTAGKYSLVKPRYLGDDQGALLQDPRTYAALDRGLEATEENQATGAERERFNRIQDLLDSEQFLEDPTEEYRRGSASADVERAKAEEQAAFEAEAAEQAAASKKWRRQVRKARKGYKSAQGVGEFGGKLVTGLTGSETLGRTIGGIGYGVGRGDAGATASAAAQLANPMMWTQAGMESARTGARNAQAAPGRGVSSARGTVTSGKKNRKKVKV